MSDVLREEEYLVNVCKVCGCHFGSLPDEPMEMCVNCIIEGYCEEYEQRED